MNVLEQFQALAKALEAGGYNAPPTSLVGGSALQREDLAPVLENVSMKNEHIKLQKFIEVEECKSVMPQFVRMLSPGDFDGAAQLEGNVGQERTGEYVRVATPMCFYSEQRKVTVVANLIETVDGKKAEDREAENAALTLAGSVERDLFRGLADFSNAGVFDGNPLALPQTVANLHGLDLQVRQSDVDVKTQDQYFADYGADASVVLAVGGVLTQGAIEDSRARSEMALGDAKDLFVDPLVLATYNKISYGKERNVLGGSPISATGATLDKQWVAFGTVQIQASRFLSAKTRPGPQRQNGPLAPTLTSVTSTTVSGVTTTMTSGQVYQYYVTTGNEVGESSKSSTVSGTVGTTGDEMVLVITAPLGTNRWYNVYRTTANGAASTAKFIGRVADSGASTTNFYDANNKAPGSITGFLVQKDTMVIKELCPFSRMKPAQTDLTIPEIYYRFLCLQVLQPRKNVLLDGLSSQLGNLS